MSTGSFSIAADVNSFTGPGGVDLKPQITGFSWTNANKTLHLTLNAQSANGVYTINVGPAITSAATGLQMDQDADLVNGEAIQDRYTGTFTLKSAIYSADMNVNPNWTISGGQWAWGDPTGNGGNPHGNPDPQVGKTGTNVIGVNLSGNYSTSVGGPFYVTTPAINASGYTDVSLNFQRWLNTDYPSYAFATVDVSNNGTTWTNLYTNPASVEVADNAWQNITYDISAVANDSPTVYIRFGYQIGPQAFAYSGWNIDDLIVTGTQLAVDSVGPRITAQTPTGNIAPGQTSMQFTFDEAMNTGSFSIASDVVSFTGPGAVDLKPQITGFTWLDDRNLRVNFNSQSAVGTYTIVIGPNITDDAPIGNQMNQDNDVTNGENLGDRYSGSFTIVPALYLANMTVNPNWTLTGQWGYGQPTGAAGDHGLPDPTSGHTGPNVIGYNLNGAYANDIATPLYATTPSFSTLGQQNVTLDFWRWLNVEQPAFDHATVEVSNDGTNWTIVFQNAATIEDSTWSHQVYDISAVADNKATVFIRFGMGTTDEDWTYAGWNIDDLLVTGTPMDANAPVVSVTPPAHNEFTTATPTISGIAGVLDGDSANITVKIYGGPTTAGTLIQTLNTTRDPGTGAWSANVTTPLLQGQYTIQAVQSDTAANTGTSAPVTIKLYTLAGDATGDGTVNFNDFVIVSQNFGQPGGWAQGNFSGSPAIGFNDFVIVSQNFGATTPVLN
jgi:hypothetical protein